MKYNICFSFKIAWANILDFKADVFMLYKVCGAQSTIILFTKQTKNKNV